MQPVIDSHFHIWRQKDQPWLVGPMVPRIFGPYEAIRRDYPIQEFLADQQPSGVQKGVYVQTNWAKEDFEKEVAFVSGVAAETGWPHAIVGYTDMTVDDARPQLDRLVRYSLLRGVRMQLHWHENPAFRFASHPRQVIDTNVKNNIKHLKEYGLSFDLQLFPAQMQDGLELVGENPDTNFILTHAGMLTSDDPTTVEEWKGGLRILAQASNAYAKLSGLGTFAHCNDPALVSLIYNATIEIFGSHRLMFGSNFPIEKLWTSHKELFAAHRAAVESKPESDRDNIFSRTAASIYRIN